MFEDLNANALRQRYRCATPWPHVAIDDAVSAELVADVAAEVEGLPRAALLRRRSRRQVKLTSNRPNDLGPRTRVLLDALSGPAITTLAETVTGIGGLVTDPEFCRAGVFVTPPGGWQRVHEDFPLHPVTGLWNRVIVLLYCSDWPRHWGGELELWPPDMSAVARRIEPQRGRLVIFEPTSAHPHGIRAVATGAGARVVLASRLYAREAPPDPPSRPLSRWTPRPEEHRRDVWPTPAEAAREFRAQIRRRLHAHASNADDDHGY
jgi:hypothetical protein